MLDLYLCVSMLLYSRIHIESLRKGAKQVNPICIIGQPQNCLSNVHIFGNIGYLQIFIVFAVNFGICVFILFFSQIRCSTPVARSRFL